MARHRLPLIDRPSREVLLEARSWPELAAGLRSVSLREDELIRVMVLGSHFDVPQLLRERSGRNLKQLGSRDSVSTFSYRRRYGVGAKHLARGEFAVATSDARNVFLLVYVGGRHFLQHGLAKLLESLYPSVTQPFLTQAELHSTLLAISRAAASDSFRIQEYSARRRLPSVKRRLETIRNWTDSDLGSAFAEAAERNVWFRSVRFAIERHGREPGPWAGVRGEISKYGVVGLDGKPDLLRSVVVPLLVSVTQKRFSLLSDRDRESAPHHDSLPLEIRYDKPVFRRTEDIKRFLDGLKRFPEGACTILHGNPYLHVSMVDNRDFSAADIWVLEEQGILIVPQLRSSPAALKRLVNYIFENFREGSLVSATEAR